MLRLLRLSVLVAATALMLQGLVGTPVAFGATASATQNPELTVSLSVPDQATVGDTVAATITIANNTSRIERIAVQGVWTDPAGTSTVTTRSGLLLPGQTVTRVVEHQVDESCLVGTHQVTITVQNGHGSSSASADIEVV